MRITNLDLNLGSGLNPQESDLNYIYDESDVICYQNGLLPAREGWKSDDLGSLGVTWREHLEDSYEHRGVFRKWAQVVEFPKFRLITVDFPKKSFNLNTIVRLVKKTREDYDGVILVTGDWSELGNDQINYLRANIGLEFYGQYYNGVYISDIDAIAGDRVLAITYGKRAVMSYGVHVD